jgi:hypothetical protein
MGPVGIVYVPFLARQDGSIGEAQVGSLLLLRAERDCEAQRGGE